jgi:phosphoribosylamine---glycine ligase
LKVLVIGGGGREHAIAWRLVRGESVETVFASPGNPGMARIGECISAGPTAETYGQIAESLGADFTVVGPEAPLAAGIVDQFRARNLRIVGPTQAAARLESSKAFSKRFMAEAGVPTASFTVVDSAAEALTALGQTTYPVVIKADGLAAGKGVTIAANRTEAEAALLSTTKAYGSRIVLEEFLQGEEVSFLVLTDGQRFLPLEPTQDHKTIFDGDAGPNTGGMGTYCDSRILTSDETGQILDTIIEPTLANMRKRGTPFTGFLYAGLMMTATGPKALEFNVRLGDPETQSLMHRVEGDWGAVLEEVARGELKQKQLHWSEQPSVCVVLASKGYPESPVTGDVITGIEEAEATGATVFHAGTRQTERGLETAGGRVLGVTARGPTLPAAIDRAYSAVEKIHFTGMQYRKDIGGKGLKRW